MAVCRWIRQQIDFTNLDDVKKFVKHRRNLFAINRDVHPVIARAIVRMTECLAVEWARYNINVNAIAPGAFSSEMMDGMLERMGDIAQHFPRKRICDPAQMDSTLMYFLSPASEAVTGTYIKIDDGQGSR